jgi:hypothetical protein
MKRDNRSKTDQILDLLLDALLERQSSRHATGNSPKSETANISVTPAFVQTDQGVVPITPQTVQQAEAGPAEKMPQVQAEQPEGQPEEAGKTEEMWAVPLEKERTPLEPLPSIQLDQMLRRLAVAVGVLILLINIPFNRNGLSLARAMPDAQSLIIRDGLVLKGSSEKIYVLEDNQKRWITSLEAFDYFGYRWEQVNVVDDAFLGRFADGRPLYVLLKCQTSPHIYALEDGQKRWIKDIPTFEAEEFVWDDVKFVSCGELRRLPTGSPIPQDAGPSPEP